MLLELQLRGESAGAEMGSTFYSPLPLCFCLNGQKEVESGINLQHSYVNKLSGVPLQPFSRTRSSALELGN